MATAIPVAAIAQPKRDSDRDTLAELLQYEADCRRVKSVQELAYHVANDTRRIIPYDQMFVLRRATIGESFRVLAASSVALVDQNAPLIQAVQAVAAKLEAKGAEAGPGPHLLDLDTLDADFAENLSDYPFRHWLWRELLDGDGNLFGFLIAAFAAPPGEKHALRLDRVGDTVGHSWRALTGGKPVRRIGPKQKLDRRKNRAIAIILGLLALFPVRMSALAPAEIVAARPFVMSAPVDGVIAAIDVPPYAQVKKGQQLLHFDDVRLRNDVELAQERLSVARARMERATSAAFADTANESRDIAIMRAEYQEALAAHKYANDLLQRTRLVAPHDGIAIYSDRREWEGHAVTIGQPIMQVANPRDIEVRIDLPARNQMNLEPGSPIRLWLDSQPLWALDGKLSHVSYMARPTAEGVLAFSLSAKLHRDAPQIGSRGTARVNGGWVPLIYSVLKRPIA